MKIMLDEDNDFVLDKQDTTTLVLSINCMFTPYAKKESKYSHVGRDNSFKGYPSDYAEIYADSVQTKIKKKNGKK